MRLLHRVRHRRLGAPRERGLSVSHPDHVGVPVPVPWEDCMSSMTAPSPALTGPPADQPVPAGRRRTEFTMLAFAVGIVIFAFANVGFGMSGRLPAGGFTYVVAFVIIMGGAHLALRRWAPYADPLLLPLAAPP